MAGMEKRLDLAAIATVADVVPLLDENRIIVAEGLKRIESSVRPGLQALLRVSATNPPLRADHLAFRIGPRLNAAGRLESADIAEQLLLTRDPEEAEILAHHLEDLNGRRQQMERATTAEADQQAKARGDFDTSRVLVVSGESWNPGLIGLTAGRLCERFHLPAVALSLQGDTAVGSCRSIPGVNIFRMLSSCADLLEHFGGHRCAAGVSVKPENLEAFKLRFEEVVNNTLPPEVMTPEIEIDAEIDFGKHITPKFLRILKQFGPFGPENNMPVFMSHSLVDTGYPRVVGTNHLKFNVISLLSRSRSFPAIGFQLGKHFPRVKKGEPFTICYTLEENYWNGRTDIQINVKDLRFDED
jgi:single-stranded-DNA-specific exonuclease